MILWFIVGLIAWVLCVLFILAIVKGGHMTLGYEQKPYFGYMVNPQNVEDSIREVEKRTALLLHN